MILLLHCVAGCADAHPPADASTDTTPQERQCLSRGWQRIEMDVAGHRRRLLWKGPTGTWTKGAILVMHGGGGDYVQWCTANARLVAPQAAFSELAISEGFAVVLLDSTAEVTDAEGRICGKIWDDEVRDRPNLDIPFIGTVLDDILPGLRPKGSREAVFLTGLSSGGYMTVRAATHFDDRITAFVPVSSGDPYGWHRTCDPDLTMRRKVHGAGFDNETDKQIIEPGSCLSEDYPHEQPWDTTAIDRKPPFRMFHDERDGINDVSCARKVERLLLAHGYPGAEAFTLDGGRRSLVNHLWQDAYNRPILAFFEQQLGDAAR